MNLNQLPKTTRRKKKRLGRGTGSGKGDHTVGRGAKGLKSRGQVSLMFTGTKLRKSFLRKMPFQRGKGKFKPLKPGPLIITLDDLNLFTKTKTVDRQALAKHGLIDPKQAQRYGVKVLANGKLKAALKVSLPCSAGAAKAIKKAGGEVLVAKQDKKQAKK